MKINVTLDVDVDPEAWDREYGTGTKPGVVVEDVLGYVVNQLRESAAGQSGAIAGVELWLPRGGGR